MNPSFAAFVDELEKISLELTPQEKSTQMAQFAGLGAVTAPTVAALGNIWKYKTPTRNIVQAISPWSPLRRWLPATMAIGAVSGGLLPAVQHGLERRLQARVKAERKMKKMLQPQVIREMPGGAQ